ncbi:Putative tail fiber component K [Sodalis praecaptivus]|uniref:Putative tail fiber component K n=1 Tax=Sodalis praecaptivus TaxID=1239307 RepID=W0HVL4_9GAMM|nr:C40 family peptidase [Sodalis praecaptivus]AHF77896.1 Putative tail fiber component K [Sodalis praecaptivus]
MIDDDILAHAEACAPAECCGLIVAGQYFPCRNIAADPDNHFEIDPVSWAAAEDKGEIEAIVHSHPDGNPFLSEADRIAQRRSGLPWWLVCDEEIRKFRNVPRLIGRTFEHGVMDCYTLMRDAYHLCGHELPYFERNDGWWKGEEDLYIANMAANGFTRLADDAEVLPGDVFLMCLDLAGQTVPKATHSAIYIGEQLILHQRPNTLSKRDCYGGFWKKITHSTWRYDKWHESDLTGISNDLVLTSTWS